VIAFRQTIVVGGGPMSRAVGINTSTASLFPQFRPRARGASEPGPSSVQSRCCLSSRASVWPKAGVFSDMGSAQRIHRIRTRTSHLLRLSSL